MICVPTAIRTKWREHCSIKLREEFDRELKKLEEMLGEPGCLQHDPMKRSAEDSGEGPDPDTGKRQKTDVPEEYPAVVMNAPVLSDTLPDNPIGQATLVGRKADVIIFSANMLMVLPDLTVR